MAQKPKPIRTILLPLLPLELKYLHRLVKADTTQRYEASVQALKGGRSESSKEKMLAEARRAWAAEGALEEKLREAIANDDKPTFGPFRETEES